jgi:hypothetical protein
MESDLHSTGHEDWRANECGGRASERCETSDVKDEEARYSRRERAKSELRGVCSEGNDGCPHEKKHRRGRGGCLRHSWQGRPKQRGRLQLEAKQSVGKFSRWGSGGNNTRRHKPSA